MGQLLPPAERQIFSLDEVRALLPELRALTQAAFDRCEAIQLAAEESSERRASQLAGCRMRNILARWMKELTVYGAVAGDTWEIHFDNGHGYFCWCLGDDEVRCWHTYDTDERISLH